MTDHVSVWSLTPPIRVHLDEWVRDQVHAPLFPLHSSIYWRVRRAKVYVHLKGRKRRVPTPCHGRPVPLELARQIAKKLEMSQKTLERHVDYATAGAPGNAAIFTRKFPVQPTTAHAFLAGLWQSSGGVTTRPRDESLCFRVDPAVAEYLATPRFVKLAGESPGRPRTQYVRQNGEVWKRRTADVCYSRVMLRVMQRLMGVDPACQRHGIRHKGIHAGRWIAFRELTGNTVPSWVSCSPMLMHAYVNGYINGGRTHAWLLSESRLGEKPFAMVGMCVRFSGVSPSAVWRQARFISAQLRWCGVSGELRRMPEWRGHRLAHLEYGFRSEVAIRNFARRFRILKTKPRTFIQAKLDKAPGWLKVLQHCDTRMAYVVSLLRFTGPKSFNELHAIVGLHPQVLRGILALARVRGLVQASGGRFQFEPSKFFALLRQSYAGRVAKNEALLVHLATALPTIRCNEGPIPVERSHLMAPLAKRTSRLRTEAGKLEGVFA